MSASILALAGLGLLLGFRHAFEPDHLAAVSTLATRQGSLLEACRLGLAWAVGHTASVGVVVLAIMAGGLHLPARLWPAADLLVALLLFGLLHGLAGSAAILVLLVAAAPTRTAQLTYFLAFGSGTMLGMLGVSVALAGIVRLASGRGARWATTLQVGSAVTSVVVGTLLAARVAA